MNWKILITEILNLAMFSKAFNLAAKRRRI